MRWKRACRDCHCAALMAGMQSIIGHGQPAACWFIGVGKGGELLAANRLWPALPIYAVDPLLRPGLPITRGWRCAAWNEETTLTVYVRGDKTSTMPSGYKRCREAIVPAVRLDRLAGVTAGPSVAFLDCETGGLAALEGGKKWLETVHWLACEMAYGKVPAGWPKAKDIQRLLRASGFRLALEIGRMRHRPKRQSSASGFDGLWVRS